MEELTFFYQQFHPKIACRLPLPSLANETAEEYLNIDAMTQGFGDINLSSFSPEKGAKRKKTRRTKTGKKISDAKEHTPATLSPLADGNEKLIDATLNTNEGWSKVSIGIWNLFLFALNSKMLLFFQSGRQAKEASKVVKH